MKRNRGRIMPLRSTASGTRRRAAEMTSVSIGESDEDDEEERRRQTDELETLVRELDLELMVDFDDEQTQTGGYTRGMNTNADQTQTSGYMRGTNTNAGANQSINVTFDSEHDDEVLPSEDSLNKGMSMKWDQDDDVIQFATPRHDDPEVIVAKANKVAEKAAEEKIELEKKLIVVLKQVDLYKSKFADLKQAYRRSRRQCSETKEDLEEAKEEWEQEKEDLELKLLSVPQTGSKPVRFTVNTTKKGKAQEEERRKKREEARRKMFLEAGEADDDDEIAGEESTSAFGFVANIVKQLQKSIRKHYPLTADLRTIEARYGSSVGAYFGFSRWVIVNYAGICIGCICSLVLHVQYVLWSAPQSMRDKMGWFPGGFPWILQYSSFSPDEDLHYTILVFGALCKLMQGTLEKFLHEDFVAKEVQVFDAVSSDAKFARLCLNAWDFGLTNTHEVGDMRSSVAQTISVTLHEETIKDKSRQRTNKQKAIMYLRRFTGQLLNLCIQICCFSIIIFLTAKSTELEAQLTTQVPELAPLSASLVPTCVSIINAALPTVMKLITKFERWDSVGSYLKWLTVRLYFGKIFNAMLTVFSFMLMMDPYLLTEDTGITLLGGTTYATIRNSAEKKFESGTTGTGAASYQCRANNVAAGLYQLVFTEFIVGKVTMVITPLVLSNVAKARKKEYTPAEFDVATMMVNLLYFQMLVLISFPFAPYTGAIGFVFFYINFKYEALVLRKFQQKPRMPWSAKNAGEFFIRFYMITLFLAIGIAHFTLANKHMPKTCDIQDAQMGLCESGTYNSSTQICTLVASDDTTVTAEARSRVAHFAAKCPASVDGGSGVGYPLCVCNNGAEVACGPFVHSINGYTEFLKSIDSISVLGDLVELGRVNITVVWVLVLYYFLSTRLRGNTLRVMADENYEKEQMWKAKNESMAKKLRKSTKRLAVLEKATHADHTDSSEAGATLSNKATD